MVDGAASLMTMIHGAHQSGWWKEERGANMLDTGAHFYEVYETSDGKYVSIGSIEPQFYAGAAREAAGSRARSSRGRWTARSGRR